MLDSLAEPFSTVESAAGARAAADIGGRPVRFTRSAGPHACSAALGAVAVTIVGFDDGGYFSATWIWTTVCFAAVAAIGVLARGIPTVRPLAWLMPISLAALGTWMLASHLWGVPGTEAGHEAARTGLYLAALGAFLIVVERATVRAFLVGILAGILALECYGLGQKAVERGDPDPTQGTLLVGPIGYANALGILSAMATLLAIGLARDERRMAARAIFVAAAVISLVALTLTSSRGAFVALGVGLLAFTALQVRNSATLGKRNWCLAMLAATVVAGGLLAIARPVARRPAVLLACSHIRRRAASRPGIRRWKLRRRLVREPPDRRERTGCTQPVPGGSRRARPGRPCPPARRPRTATRCDRAPSGNGHHPDRRRRVRRVPRPCRARLGLGGPGDDACRARLRSRTARLGATAPLSVS